MRRFENLIWWTMVATIGALLVATMAASGEDFAPSERQVLLHEEAQRHRITHGRERQEIDADLCALSQRWAEHMARTGSRSHGGGENIIAWGQSSAPQAMQTWIESKGHNYWLLSGTTRAGWGAAYSQRGGWMWVGAFRGPAVAVETAPTATHTNGRRAVRVFRFFR